MNAVNSERRLARNLDAEADAARDLLASLNSDNPDLNHDMVEGETNLMEALGAAVGLIDDALAIVAGCKDREAVFSARRAAAERQVERVRTLIEQAMIRGGLDTIRLAAGTMTVKSTPAKPVYVNEADIPAKFWKAGAPSLDKAAINEAIKAGETVPGVSMSNGGISLQIRRN